MGEEGNLLEHVSKGPCPGIYFVVALQHISRLFLEAKQSFEGKRANELLRNTFGFKRPVSLRPIARGVWATAFCKRDVVDQRTGETDISRDRILLRVAFSVQRTIKTCDSNKFPLFIH
ncbi:hypothetical protein J6590_090892 [Homalodisca vitripennis]|nr:hypothetical protein J6590_068673 [Homalodisca vitripennis]KAG8314537.1 hypothetical protein J6590_090892 [Homalodisca vitripennis]